MKRVLRLMLVAASLVVTTQPASATELALPVEVRNGPILVRAERGLDEAARRIAERAPAALERIGADLPDLPHPRSAEIRLVRRARDLARVAPAGRGAPPWAVGVSYSGTGVVSAATRRENQPVDIDSTVTHELAHLALDTAMAGSHAPRWLHEGFAYLHSSDFSFERSRVLTGMAWTGDVIPLAELDRRFPAAEMAAHRAYVESYDFVSFLARRGRFPDRSDDGDRWPFRDFIAGIARGKTPDQAARSAFGTPLHMLFQEWVETMRDQYMLSPIGLFGIFVWAVGGVLLVFAYVRKRRLAKRTLARWEQEESAAPEPDLVPLRPLDQAPPSEPRD